MIHAIHKAPLRAFLTAMLVLLMTRTFLLDAAVVEGDSMEPTLRHGRIVIVVRAAYGLRSFGGRYLVLWAAPRQGDIVATTNPSTGRPVVKRIVSALPGLDPSIPSLFLMGDNPGSSLDSRIYGLVPVESVIGRVLLWPHG